MLKNGPDFNEELWVRKLSFLGFATLYVCWDFLTDSEKDNMVNGKDPSTRNEQKFCKALEFLKIDFNVFRDLYNCWISLSERERIEEYRVAKIERIYELPK